MYYGDLGKRVLAAIIDWLILWTASFFLGFIFGYAGVIIAPLVPFFYRMLMEGGGWHATLGKKMLGLYVADENGVGITYSTAVLRQIGKVLTGLTLGIGYLIGFFNDKKQCLHDMIAKTYVLNEQPRVVPQNQNVNVNAYGKAPKLVGINGPLAGMIYQFNDRGLIMGRDNISCQVVIPDSQAKVSRIHCYVTFNPMSGMFVLNDRNSTHGTFLANGRRVTYAQPAALNSGDRFYLATPENTFEVR